MPFWKRKKKKQLEIIKDEFEFVDQEEQYGTTKISDDSEKLKKIEQLHQTLSNKIGELYIKNKLENGKKFDQKQGKLKRLYQNVINIFQTVAAEPTEVVGEKRKLGKSESSSQQLEKSFAEYTKWLDSLFKDLAPNEEDKEELERIKLEFRTQLVGVPEEQAFKNKTEEEDFESAKYKEESTDTIKVKRKKSEDNYKSEADLLNKFGHKSTTPKDLQKVLKDEGAKKTRERSDAFLRHRKR